MEYLEARRPDNLFGRTRGSRLGYPWPFTPTPSPGRRSRILNMLNEILVCELSLAIWSIRTNHLRGSSYGYPGVVVSAEAFVTLATERRTPVWTA